MSLRFIETRLGKILLVSLVFLGVSSVANVVRAGSALQLFAAIAFIVVLIVGIARLLASGVRPAGPERVTISRILSRSRSIEVCDPPEFSFKEERRFGYRLVIADTSGVGHETDLCFPGPSLEPPDRRVS
jgi:hypothetical protein